MRDTEALRKARVDMEICNACRYCEGYCAVFPAMELRRSFTNADLSYLANLCHNCRGCYYSCQYAPPHEFGVNLPQSFARLRVDSYEQYAWPQPLARLLRHNGLVVSLATAAALAAVFVLVIGLRGSATVTAPHRGPGAFYAIVPWAVMVGVASLSFLFSLLALAIGFVRFWRDIGGRGSDLIRPRPLARALHDIFTLHNLGGGGQGCNYPDEAQSNVRRRLHHLMFYGFMLCFASTCVATVYDHFLNDIAPYPLLSAPVLLGGFGGVGLLIGAGGLLWLRLRSDQQPDARELLGMDAAFLALLIGVAFTGLALLGLRASAAMGVALSIHLGFVLALFLSLPYSKFVHGVYRSGALLYNALEQSGAHKTAAAGVSA